MQANILCDICPTHQLSHFRSVWQDRPQTGDQAAAAAGGGPAARGAGHAVPDTERVPADGHVPRPDRAGVRLGRAVPRPLSGERLCWEIVLHCLLSAREYLLFRL